MGVGNATPGDTECKRSEKTGCSMFYRINSQSTCSTTHADRRRTWIPNFVQLGLIRERTRPRSGRNAARVPRILRPKLRIAEQDRRPRWRDAIDGFVLVGRQVATEAHNINETESVSRCRGKRKVAGDGIKPVEPERDLTIK
jgi:hypothetical protein